MEKKVLAVALVLSILFDSALMVGNILENNWPMALCTLFIDGMFVYILYIGYKSTTRGKK